MAQMFMSKLSANERMALWGAVIVFIVALIGTSWLTLILSAAVVVVYYLKYSPTSNITWPIQPQVINLAISGVIGVLAVLGALFLFGIGGAFGGLGFGFLGGLFIVVLVGAVVNLIGAGMMVLGTWREYQAMPKTAPPTPPAPPAPPAA